jgi:FG-GAP-like repeat
MQKAFSMFRGYGRLFLALVGALVLDSSSLAQVSGCFGGDGTFGPGTDFHAGFDAANPATGDLDGDGDLDLVVANYGATAISVLYGAGDGSFSLPSSYSVFQTVRSVSLVDVDADGALDAVVSANGLPVLMGTGNGLFGTPTALAPGHNADGVVSGDLNGDSVIDLVFQEGSSGKLGVLLGLGGGAFGPPVDYGLGVSRSGVELADLDGDGSLDLIDVAFVPSGGPSPSGWQLISRLGVGDGTFHQGVAHALGGSVRDLAVTDLNGDGRQDCVVTSANSVSVLIGNGDGTLGAPVGYPAGSAPGHLVLEDLNSDDYPDALVANSVATLSILSGDGGGGFASPTAIVTQYNPGSGLLVSDFDGSGSLDIVAILAAPFFPEVTVYLGGGGGLDDNFEPNHSCAASALLAPGQFAQLTVSPGDDGDFFAIDVPPGFGASVNVEFVHAFGDIDCFVYSASGLQGACGDQLSYILSSQSVTNAESLYWLNSGVSVATYVLQVTRVGPLGASDCSVYSIDLSVAEPLVGDAVCSGAEGLATCPCGNQSADPESGCVNATGVGAKIFATGTASVAANDLVMHLSQARIGQVAVLVQGEALISHHFRDGVLCMGGSTERVELVYLDTGGSGCTMESIVVNGNVPGPGATRFYQYWYRDPQFSPCGTGSNLSNAVRVDWQ